MNDITKYNYMEGVLENISKNFISLSENEIKRNNKILDNVLHQIIVKLKLNLLFNVSYRTVFYGGSFYDGLKVEKPEEYDLDLLLTLPVSAGPELNISNIPGYMHMHLKEYEKFMKLQEANSWRGLETWLDEKHYLVIPKVYSWFQKILRKALNEFDLTPDGSPKFVTDSGYFKGGVRQSGPAQTLRLTEICPGNPIIIDIDLVPCFVFGKEKWPPSPFRQNPIAHKPEFFVVPKQPKNDNFDTSRYWRLSFQIQERELINNAARLKPALKLIKKLRNNLHHNEVASYFIKTIFLWEDEKDHSLWNNSLSYVFMFMLTKYKESLQNKKISYFWNKRNDLLKPKDTTLTNFANAIQRIINHIERCPNDPGIVANYLLDANQLALYKQNTVCTTSSLVPDDSPNAEEAPSFLENIVDIVGAIAEVASHWRSDEQSSNIDRGSLQTQIDDMRSDIKRLRLQNRDLTDQVQDLTLTLQTARREINDLRNMLHNSNRLL